MEAYAELDEGQERSRIISLQTSYLTVSLHNPQRNNNEQIILASEFVSPKKKKEESCGIFFPQ